MKAIKTILKAFLFFLAIHRFIYSALCPVLVCPVGELSQLLPFHRVSAALVCTSSPYGKL